jgi:hypothetical protein
MLKALTSMKIAISQAIFTANFRQVSPATLLGVSAGNCQTALVDESGMIITQIRTQYRSEMVIKLGTL